MNSYIIVYPDELNHYGVKGMKWGVRRRQVKSAYGYGLGREYTEKRDLKRLRQNRKATGMTRSIYKAERSKIKTIARKDRGKALVNANQTYRKTLVKGIAKTTACGLGAAAIGAYGLSKGAGFIAIPGAAALGTMATAHTIGNTRKRMRDIRTYTRN